MKLRPLQDRILVQRVEEETTTKGGIIMKNFVYTVVLSVTVVTLVGIVIIAEQYISYNSGALSPFREG